MVSWRFKGGGGRILSDFRDLSFCVPCGLVLTLKIVNICYIYMNVFSCIIHMCMYIVYLFDGYHIVTIPYIFFSHCPSLSPITITVDDHLLSEFTIILDK